jgi:hypothetical protein
MTPSPILLNLLGGHASARTLSSLANAALDFLRGRSTPNVCPETVERTPPRLYKSLKCELRDLTVHLYSQGDSLSFPFVCVFSCVGSGVELRGLGHRPCACTESPPSDRVLRESLRPWEHIPKPPPQHTLKRTTSRLSQAQYTLEVQTSRLAQTPGPL